VPNSYQVYPQNATLTSNPNNTLSFNPTSIINSSGAATELPEITLEMIETAVTSFLGALETVTGIPLELLSSAFTTLFGDVGSFDPLTAITTFITLVISLAGSLPVLPAALIEGLSGLFGDVQGTIDGIIGGITGDSNSSDNPVQMVEYWIGKLTTGVSTATSTATSASTNVFSLGSALSQVVNNLDASPLFTDSEAFLAAVGADIGSWFGITTNTQSTAVAAVTAAATTANTLTGKTVSGNSDTDPFNRVGTTIDSTGLIWAATNTGAGEVQTDLVDAFWVPSGTAAATELDRFVRTQTQTDYQIIGVVLDSPLMQPGSAQGIIGRCDTAKENYVFLHWDGTNISMFMVIGGVKTQIGTSEPYTPKVGDHVQLIPGTATSVREFLGTVNGAPLIDVTDTTGTSVIGPANRSGGLHWEVGAGPEIPGNVHSFHIADNNFGGTTGSGAAMTRLGTAAVTIPSTPTSNLTPTNFFDTEQFATADITVDLADGKFTVSRPGLYMVTVRANRPGSTGSRQVSSLLYKNGSLYQWGVSLLMSDTGGDVQAAIWSQFLVQLNAGDFVQSGWDNSISTDSGTTTFVGEPTGTQTYLTISAASQSGY
jgi:hypothetical protein